MVKTTQDKEPPKPVTVPAHPRASMSDKEATVEPHAGDKLPMREPVHHEEHDKEPPTLAPDGVRRLRALEAREPDDDFSDEEKDELRELRAIRDKRAEHDEKVALEADKVAAGPFSVEQWRHLREKLPDLYDEGLRRRGAAQRHATSQPPIP